MTFAPQCVYTDEGRESRLYSEMNTADWWWDVQVRLFKNIGVGVNRT
jgi:hypothetical protein